MRSVAVGGLGPFYLEIWDLHTKKRLSTFERPDNPTDTIRTLAYTPDGKTLVAAADQTIHFLDAKSGKTAAEIPERLVLSLAISPDGRRLATGRYDGVTLWDLQKRVKSPLRWNVAAVESIQFSPDGRFLAAGSSDGSVHVWDVKTGDLEWSWNFPERHAAEILMRIKMVLVLAWSAGFLLYVGRRYRTRRARRRASALEV